MPKRSHPAQRSRVIASLAGATGFVAMVGTISEGSKQTITIDTAARLNEAAAAAADAQASLDLNGGGLAGQAAATSQNPAGDGQTDVATQDQNPSAPAATETTATGPPATESPASDSPATESTETPGTVPEGSAPDPGADPAGTQPATDATTTPTTAAPAPTSAVPTTPPTTAPTTTDTASSGS